MSIRYVLPTPWLSIYNSPIILLVERLFKWYWVLFCYFILWLAKSGSKMPCILHFENICSSSLLQMLYFYTVLPTPRFKQLLFDGSYSKNPNNFETYVFGRLFFDSELIASKLFKRNLSIVHQTLFKNFVIAPLMRR